MAILSNGKFYGFLCSAKETGQKLANGVKEYVEDFVSGFAGHGWKIWEYMKGKWKLEIDTIIVRETMLVFEMLISKIRAIIGAQAITQGHGKVKSVNLSDDGTEYLIELEDEDMSIVAHDFVRCQTFTGDNSKLYHVEVSSVDVETRTLHVPLTEFAQDEAGNVLNPPVTGDELVQFGNSQNKSRQSAIYMHADETGQPAIDVMFDIDSKNWEGKVKVRVGGDIPGANGLKGFYCVNGMIKSVDDKGAIIYEFSPNGAVNIGKGNITYNPTTNKVTLGSGVTLTWDNLSDESKENLKGEPGQDANLLPWIEKWNGYATELGEEYIVTPKMFSGVRNADGTLTGIAQGKGCIEIDGVTRTGIFALVDDKVVFKLDPEYKEYVFEGKIVADSIVMKEFALLSSAVFKGDYMFSQHGKDAAGNDTSDYSLFEPEKVGQSNAPFTPNALVDWLSGTIKARKLIADGAVLTNVKGLTGTFRSLQGVDDNNKVKCAIGFSTSEGKMYFEGDMQHQGYDYENNRGYRFLTADLWCRGSFGARERTVLEVRGSYGYFYTKGLSKSGVYVSLASGISSANETYYNVPCFGLNGDYIGMPVDIVVFTNSYSYANYHLVMDDSQRVLVVNANNNHKVYIYSHGNKVVWEGGELAEVVSLPSMVRPTQADNILGRGLFIGAFRDNNW